MGVARNAGNDLVGQLKWNEEWSTLPHYKKHYKAGTEYCRLLETSRVARDWYRLKLHSPRLAQARPGQFVHLLPGKKGDTDPLLRRPFSIHYMDPDSAEIWLAIREAGRGTARIANMQCGEMLD